MAYLPGNHSISGTAGASVIGLPPFKIGESTNASVITVGTPAANQSVSGTVQVDVRGSVATVIIGGSIATTTGNSSVQVLNFPANQSVSGAVSISNFPTTQNVAGSVVTFQGTPEWTVKSSLTGGIFPVSGSVAATITNTNVNVSGSVVAFGFPTNQNVSGSVVATQGTTPWIVTGNNNSVIGVQQGSVAVAIVSGSVAVATGNSSVQVLNFPTTQNVSGSVASFQQGTNITSLVSTVPSSVIVGTSIFGQLPGGTAVLGSITTLQGTNPWIITGSVQGSFSPSGNQSVSGTVQAELLSTNASVIAVGQSSFAVAIVSGSVAVATGNSSVQVLNFPANQSVSGAVSISNFPTTQNVSGSVAAWLQSTNASVITVGTAAANQSVSGTVDVSQIGTWRVSVVSSSPSSMLVGASIIGIAPVTLTANTTPASALAFLGATTSITAANSSVITVTGYPTARLQITSNPSMTATILFEGSADNSSWVPITGQDQATNQLASVTTVADSNWSFNTAGLQTFRARLSAWTAGSITGKVYLSPVDARPNVFTGSVSAAISNTNVNVSGSVASFQQGTWSVSVMTNVITSIATAGQVMGSVAALQATNPWIVNFQNSSIIAINAGSVITINPGSIITTFSQGPSIVGTYAEDTTHTAADKGLFILGVRNDAITSIAGADRDYAPVAVDEASRQIVVPFAGNKACIISYFGSIVSGSVQLIKASVIGSKSYITDFWLSNTGSTTTLVTFQGGDTSLLGQFVVPAGGGSNSPGIAIPLQTTLSQDLAFKVAPSQSILYAVIKGYQAP